MPKNLLIDGKVYHNVKALRAMDADTEELVLFPDTSDATAEDTDISSGKTAYVDGVLVHGSNTGVEPNDLDGLVDGSITHFVMPTGMKEIKPYLFLESDLTDADLGAVEVIGRYAFYNISAWSIPVLNATIKDVGNYAFYSFGKILFVFKPTNECIVGTYAFQSSKISELEGDFTNIGTYAFQGCTSLNSIDISCDNIGTYAFADAALTTVKAEINGAIPDYCFSNNPNVSSVEITGDITTINQYAFSRFASNRTNAASNPITLDFRNHSIISLATYAFGYSSSTASQRNKYMTLEFPDTLTTIATYAFRYTDNCNFYFTSQIPPTLSATTTWSNATNYKIFVPYTGLNDYRTATNWSSHTANIVGYAEPNTFVTFPVYSVDGYEFSWFKDTALTVPATIVEEDTEYYCVTGNDKVAFGYIQAHLMNCTITVSDGTRTYYPGEGILENNVVTITATPDTSGWVPYIFTVNGQEFTNGDTFTMDTDLNITAVFWDEVNLPGDPVFANNTWIVISNIFAQGAAAAFWSVGDTKPVTLTNGTVLNIRIVDMQENRYQLSDSSGGNKGVFDFVECFPTAYRMNSSNTNANGWAGSEMKNTHMETLYNLLPLEVRSAMSEVSVASATSGTNSTLSYSDNKLFLPSEYEIFGVRIYSNTTENTPQFDWFKDNNTNAARIKRIAGTVQWWLRSPSSGNSDGFCLVYSGGGAVYGYASGSYGTSPCFAI